MLWSISVSQVYNIAVKDVNTTVVSLEIPDRALVSKAGVSEGWFSQEW